jgi:hypothetical protein
MQERAHERAKTRPVAEASATQAHQSDGLTPSLQRVDAAGCGDQRLRPGVWASDVPLRLKSWKEDVGPGFVRNLRRRPVPTLSSGHGPAQVDRIGRAGSNQR